MEFASAIASGRAVSLANGTVALELALRALGIGRGDEVVVTPRSFIASASCVVTVGARPVFADVDRNSQCLSAATVEKVLTDRTRALVVVHLAGHPAEMDDLMALAESRGIEMIEDCAQAHGALYRGRSVGSIGHVGAWSFCQDKIMTTGGEGGMVTTDDEALWADMWAYKDHGKSWAAVNEPARGPGFRWLHESFGTNWRMTEMQAAIGRIQLTRLPEWRRRRQANASRIWHTCRAVEWLRVPDVPSHVEHAAYKAYAFVIPDRLPRGWSRDRVLAELLELGIPAYSGSCSEVYLERAFEGTGYAPPERLPVARELGETSLMFLVHPTLRDDEIEATCEAIRAVDERVRKAAARQVSGADV